MVYVKWVFNIVLLSLVFAFFHYTLPQHDIARVTDTYEKRIDFDNNSIFWSSAGGGNEQAMANRDVFFIQTKQADGDTMVYRNEDTGWGWPPYFKFHTANLQAEAVDLKSTSEAPKWVAIKHYGWRSELLSIYPNAVSIWQVAGPDVRLIPWFNIVFLTILFAVYWGVRVRWIRFRKHRIDRKIDEWTEGWG